jgi:putative DNA primase/helicase
MSAFDNLTVEQIEQLLAAKKSQENIPFVDVTAKGAVKGTLENFQMLLNHYSVTIRYNEMTKEPEIDIPGDTSHADIAINAKIAQLISYANKHGFPKGDVLDLVTVVASNNAYHPVRDWIDAQEWDGVDRLQEFTDTVILKTENELKTTIMRKWALAAVAALYHPNFSCEGVLTFTGNQGVGKTTWAFGLLPRERAGEWIKDGVTLDMGNKDTAIKALGFWITELGELDATFKKSDIEALKAFITEKVDMIRPPYSRSANKYGRRTVFYASVNELEFLKDSENRRFWVLEVERFVFPSFDVGQFWAQIKQEYQAIRDLIATAEDRSRNNEWGWFMSPRERQQLADSQQRFKTVNSIDEMLANRVITADHARVNYKRKMNITAILQDCGVMMPTQTHLVQAGKWLRAAGYQPDRMKQYEVDMVPDVQEHMMLQKKMGKFKVTY